jgi:hypothetical protein
MCPGVGDTGELERGGLAWQTSLTAFSVSGALFSINQTRLGKTAISLSHVLHTVVVDC